MQFALKLGLSKNSFSNAEYTTQRFSKIDFSYYLHVKFNTSYLSQLNVRVNVVYFCCSDNLNFVNCQTLQVLNNHILLIINLCKAFMVTFVKPFSVFHGIGPCLVVLVDAFGTYLNKLQAAQLNCTLPLETILKCSSNRLLQKKKKQAL